MSIGSRIKEARNIKKYSQNTLGKMIHRSRSAISNYELDKRDLDPETIGILADALDVDPNFLLQDYYEGSVPVFTLKTLIHARKYDKLDLEGKRKVDYQQNMEEKRISQSYSGNDYIYLPFYPNINAFDGRLEALSLPILDTIENCGVSFIAAMPDDSMEPVFEKNELLLFEKTDSIRNKEIGIFMIKDDRIVIRRLVNNHLCNKDKDSDVIIYDTDVTCMGRYIRTYNQKKNVL